ncbi:transposase [Ochrobactrum sp. J50]|nr:transposase [Ochrobactrum sp. J50]
MSQSINLSQFPDFPPAVVKAFADVQFKPSERAARQHEQAVVPEKDVFIAELKELIEKLEGQVQEYRRTKFGPKSEQLDPAQMELTLEYLETAIGETQARALPADLPRVEHVIEPLSSACPCGCGDMVRIGKDKTERLDYIPASYQVIVTICLKYACPKGRTGVVQAKAPVHLLEGSWPTEALLAQIAVSKRSEPMQLNRQAVVMARHGYQLTVLFWPTGWGAQTHRSRRSWSTWR